MWDKTSRLMPTPLSWILIASSFFSALFKQTSTRPFLEIASKALSIRFERTLEAWEDSIWVNRCSFFNKLVNWSSTPFFPWCWTLFSETICLRIGKISWDVSFSIKFKLFSVMGLTLSFVSKILSATPLILETTSFMRTFECQESFPGQFVSRNQNTYAWRDGQFAIA